MGKEENKLLRENSAQKPCPLPRQQQEEVQFILPYDMKALIWDAKHHSNNLQKYCYCGGPGQWYNHMIQCQRCQQWFHEACLDCLHYPLVCGDRFYIFVCSLCNEGTEFLHRLDLKCVDVVHLALYNLICKDRKPFYEFDSSIMQWINDNWENLQLPLGVQSMKGQERRDKMLYVLETHSFRFRCGREFKKRNDIWRLRQPVPPPVQNITLPASGVINDNSVKNIICQYKKSGIADSNPPAPKSSNHKKQGDGKGLKSFSPNKKQGCSPSHIVEQKKKEGKRGKGEEEEGKKKKKSKYEADNLIEEEVRKINREISTESENQAEMLVKKKRDPSSKKLDNNNVAGHQTVQELVSLQQEKKLKSFTGEIGQVLDTNWMRFHVEGEGCTCSVCIEIEDFINKVEEEAASQLQSLLGNSYLEDVKEGRPWKAGHSEPKSSKQELTPAAESSKHSHMSRRNMVSEESSCGESHALRRTRSQTNNLLLKDPSISEAQTEDVSGLAGTSLLTPDQLVKSTESKATVRDKFSGIGSRAKDNRRNRCIYCHCTKKTFQGLKSHLRACKWARAGHAKPQNKADSSGEIATSLPVLDQSVKGTESNAPLTNKVTKLSNKLQKKPNLCTHCHGTFKKLTALISHMKACKRAKTDHMKPKNNIDSPVETATSLHIPDQSTKNTENKPSLPGTLSELGILLNDKPVKCSYCHGSFKTIKGLKCHIKTCKVAKTDYLMSKKNTDLSLETNLPVLDQAVKNTEIKVSFPGTLLDLGNGVQDKKVLQCNQCCTTFDKIQSLECHIKACKFTENGHSMAKKKSDSLEKIAANLPTSDQLMKGTENNANLPDTLNSRLQDQKPFQCTYCGCTFKTGKFLMCHAKSCNYTKSAIAKMMLTELKKQSDMGKTVAGGDCLIDGTLSTMSLKEDRTLVVDRPLRCPYCRKTYETQNSLDAHISTHAEMRPTELRPYSCTYCKKTFQKVRSLKLHIMIHTDEKPFKCKYCSASFRSNTQRTLHHRIHTGEKPFKCSMCDAAFSRSNALTIHIRIHSGDKPYKCSKCPLSYARKDHLRRHMLKHT